MQFGSSPTLPCSPLFISSAPPPVPLMGSFGFLSSPAATGGAPPPPPPFLQPPGLLQAAARTLPGGDSLLHAAPSLQARPIDRVPCSRPTAQRAPLPPPLPPRPPRPSRASRDAGGGMADATDMRHFFPAADTHAATACAADSPTGAASDAPATSEAAPPCGEGLKP